MGLLEMSLSAGVLISCLLLLRVLLRPGIAGRVFVLLWMVVLLRLLLPVSLPLPVGVATPLVRLLQQKTGDAADVSVPEKRPGAASSGQLTDTMHGKQWESFFAKTQKARRFIWIGGMAVSALYFLRRMHREYRLLAQALPVEGLDMLLHTAARLVGVRCKTRRLLTHDRIATALVRGVIRQQIVLPVGIEHMEQQQLLYILTHEMVHVRRRDNLWKLLSAVAVCVHWFNPLVWVMYVLLARDLELSCDEQVLALYGRDSRRAYAMTLLALAEKNKKKTLFCSGFGKNPTKERIVAIMKYKKLTGLSVFCAVVLLAGATTVFATNDKKPVKEYKIVEADDTQLGAEREAAEESVLVEKRADEAAERGAAQESVLVEKRADEVTQREAAQDSVRVKNVRESVNAQTNADTGTDAGVPSEEARLVETTADEAEQAGFAVDAEQAGFAVDANEQESYLLIENGEGKARYRLEEVESRQSDKSINAQVSN